MPVPTPRRMRHGIAFAAFEFEGGVRSALHRGKYGGSRLSRSAGRLDGRPAGRAASESAALDSGCGGRGAAGASPAPSARLQPVRPDRSRRRGCPATAAGGWSCAGFATLRNRAPATKTGRGRTSPGPLPGRNARWRARRGLVNDVLTTAPTVKAPPTVLGPRAADRRRGGGWGAVIGAPCQNEEEYVHPSQAAAQGPGRPCPA